MLRGKTASQVIKKVIGEVDCSGILQTRTEGPNKEKSIELKEFPGMHFAIDDPTKNWCGIPNLRQQAGLCLVEVLDYLLGLNPGYIHHFHEQHKKWLTVDSWWSRQWPEKPAVKEAKELAPYTYGDRIRHWPGTDLPITDIINIGLENTPYDYIVTWNSNQDHFYEGVSAGTSKPTPTWQVDQLEVCIEKLQKNPVTRHAIISFWNPINDHGRAYCPCTMTWHFELREREQEKPELDMHCTIRSNDAVWGLPFDIFDATLHQQVVAARLGVPVGKYFQTSNNMHVYDRHFHLFDNILEEKFEIYDHIDPLPMWDGDDGWKKEEFNYTMLAMKSFMDELIRNRIQGPNSCRALSNLNAYWQNYAHAIACDWFRIKGEYDRSGEYLYRIENEWWLPLAQRLYRSIKVNAKDEFPILAQDIVTQGKEKFRTDLITPFRATWKKPIPVIVPRSEN